MRKIYDLKTLSKILIKKKKLNKKIVLSHGAFDLLHLGHIRHFNSAKKKGDILVVSLTSDEFIKKGPNRPFFNLQERLEAISNLDCVDYLTWSNSIDAIEVIKILKPNVYCKGIDYLRNHDDPTGNIKKEKEAIKKIKGSIFITKDKKFSSTKILSEKNLILDQEQKNFLKKIKKYDSSYIKDLIKKIKKIKPLVIGEIIIDQYSFGEALGKSGKEPIMMIKKLNEEQYLGGSGAISNHVSNFVDKVVLLSMIGEKKEHLKFIHNKLKKNIRHNFLYKKNSPTIVKKKYLDYISGNKIIGFYEINDNHLSEIDKKKIILKFKKKLKKTDLIIVADYGHSMINNEIAKLISSQKKFTSVNCQINAANIGTSSIKKYKNVDLIIINENEIRSEFKDKSSTVDYLAKKLCSELKSKFVVVTRGSNGVLMYSKIKNKTFKCPAFASKVVDRIGAGDVMLSILSIFLKYTKNENFSLFIGSIASAQHVQTIGNKEVIKKEDVVKIYNQLNA